jgi:hypothetical protein
MTGKPYDEGVRKLKKERLPIPDGPKPEKRSGSRRNALEIAG